MRSVVQLMEQAAPRRPRAIAGAVVEFLKMVNAEELEEQKYTDETSVDPETLESILRSISFIGPAMTAERFAEFSRKIRELPGPPHWARKFEYAARAAEEVGRRGRGRGRPIETTSSSSALFSLLGGYLSSRLPWMTTSTLHEDVDFLAFVDVFEDVWRARCRRPLTISPIFLDRFQYLRGVVKIDEPPGRRRNAKGAPTAAQLIFEQSRSLGVLRRPAVYQQRSIVTTTHDHDYERVKGHLPPIAKSPGVSTGAPHPISLSTELTARSGVLQSSHAGPSPWARSIGAPVFSLAPQAPPALYVPLLQ